MPQLILRELSFSGQAMTTAQIAKAIEYLPDLTETGLEPISPTKQGALCQPVAKADQEDISTI